MAPATRPVHPYLANTSPIAVAHRGGDETFPENTMAAFGEAVRLGFDYIETDVHLTKDGVVLAFHDERLDRLTGQSGCIEDFSWDEIRHITVGADERIPRLEDILTAWPETKLNIDPKSDAVVAPLLAVLASYDAWDRICIGSFSHARLAHVRAHRNGHIATSASPREVAAIKLASLGAPSGWLPRVDALCLQIPVRHRGIPVVNERLLEYAHGRGLPVHVWTINDRAEMERLLNLGVDAIMTDAVSVLRDVFEARQLPLGGGA